MSAYFPPSGSVAVLQADPTKLVGTVSVVGINFSNSSVVAVLRNSSVSGVGLFNVNHTGNGSVMAIEYLVRNDTLASTLGVDGTIGPGARTSAGLAVIKPFAPNESTFNYTGSVVSGSVTLISASVTGKRSYITDFWIANTNTVSSVSALVTFQDGSTSIIGRTIAPAQGGSNAPGLAIPLKTNPSQDLAFIVSPAPSILYVTVNGYQAP